MTLKAGSVANFSNSLAAEMDKAMLAEWKALKGMDLPAQGEPDRHVLFAAIAQGLFVYLKAHQDELISVITMRENDGVSSDKNYLVTQLELDL